MSKILENIGFTFLGAAIFLLVVGTLIGILFTIDSTIGYMGALILSSFIGVSYLLGQALKLYILNRK